MLLRILTPCEKEERVASCCCRASCSSAGFDGVVRGVEFEACSSEGARSNGVTVTVLPIFILSLRTLGAPYGTSGLVELLE
jgi:hypothetical protein